MLEVRRTIYIVELPRGCIQVADLPEFILGARLLTGTRCQGVSHGVLRCAHTGTRGHPQTWALSHRGMHAMEPLKERRLLPSHQSLGSARMDLGSCRIDPRAMGGGAVIPRDVAMLAPACATSLHGAASNGSRPSVGCHSHQLSFPTDSGDDLCRSRRAR